MFRPARTTLGLALIAAVSLVPAPAQAQIRWPRDPKPRPSDIERALDHLGLDRRDVRIRRSDLARLADNRRPGSLLGYLFEEPFATKTFAQHVRATLLQELRQPPPGKFQSTFWSDLDGFDRNVARVVPEAAVANVISKLSRWSDNVLRRTLLGNPIRADMDEAAKSKAMYEAIKTLHSHAGKPLPKKDRKKLSTKVKRLPPAVRRAAALILRVADRAVTARDRAIRRFDRSVLQDLTVLPQRLEFGEPDGAPIDDDRDRLAQFEVGPIIGAAQELALAAAVSATLLDGCDLPAAAFAWKTPYGEIRIDTKGKTTYDDDTPYLLIIDTDGNDKYRAGASAVGLDNPVSVLLDIDGNDTYRAAHDPIIPADESKRANAKKTKDKDDKRVAPASRRSNGKQDKPTYAAVPDQAVHAVFGAAMLGVAILYDTAGNDEYEAVQRSMGYGLFGVGVLVDLAGDDHYDAIADSQGMAQAGIGLLLDLDGNDRYDCYTQSQGFGYLDGLGCLLDARGDDRYIGNTTDIRFPAAQSDKQNNSMSQGAGCGRRADYSDGHSYPGGVGILLDGDGTDVYECGIFGQGTGYWLGTGLCIDAAGDDKYAGAWYVQGAAAHFAAGVLLDEAGNDTYKATMATSLGTGHDLSLGFLADLAGDDHYSAGGLTMGSGNVGGIGILVDVAGDDDYQIPEANTLGNANAGQGVRGTMITLGLFLDGGGKDTYSRPYARDNNIWGNGPDHAFERFNLLRYAIGLDTTLTEPQLERLWAPIIVGE